MDKAVHREAEMTEEQYAQFCRLMERAKEISSTMRCRCRVSPMQT